MKENAAKQGNMPEILAPAGNWEALEAAVKAGADAVYVGGDLFSARAFAGNFDTEEMIRAIDFCHLYGVKLYMALNTLLKPSEIGQVEEYVRPMYREGVDGMIVQDMGVVRVLSRAFPDLPLHASTQMSISSRYGAQFLKDCGFTRIVPARELSLAEIRSIKSAVGIEIESFVHGAMCFAYSGKCLFSSFLGGRSGNRGRCAQSCRQCYEIQGGRGSVKEYIMSLKDMCTLTELPELIDAGIDSFKIEGRMKKPEYVAATVDAYRRTRDMYLDGKWSSDAVAQRVADMQDIYNRGGFSGGYYHIHNDRSMLANTRPNHTGLKVGTVTKVAPPEVGIRLERDVSAQDVLEIRNETGAADGVELTSASGGRSGGMLTVRGKEFKKIRKGMAVYRTRNNALLKKVREEILEPERTIPVEAVVEAAAGEPLVIRMKQTESGVQTEVRGNIVSAAQSRPADEEKIIEKMQKTGGSGLRVEKVECRLGENAFVQMSELNTLRRAAAESLKEAIEGQYRRKS